MAKRVGTTQSSLETKRIQKEKHVANVGIVFEGGASGPTANESLSLVPHRRIEKNERVDESGYGEIGKNYG